MSLQIYHKLNVLLFLIFINQLKLKIFKLKTIRINTIIKTKYNNKFNIDNVEN